MTKLEDGGTKDLRDALDIIGMTMRAARNLALAKRDESGEPSRQEIGSAVQAGLSGLSTFKDIK